VCQNPPGNISVLLSSDQSKNERFVISAIFMMGQLSRSLTIEFLLMIGLLFKLPVVLSFTRSKACFSGRFSTRINTTRDTSTCPPQISIVGGGLAGLSTAYHFLTRVDNCDAVVTIYDKFPVGKGGASAVAGGYVLLDITFFFLTVISMRKE